MWRGQPTVAQTTDRVADKRLGRRQVLAGVTRGSRNLCDPGGCPTSKLRSVDICVTMPVAHTQQLAPNDSIRNPLRGGACPCPRRALRPGATGVEDSLLRLRSGRRSPGMHRARYRARGATLSARRPRRAPKGARRGLDGPNMISG